ncbi:amino acid adenylation domain-containing protein [Micromonospora sp. NPDC005413]|uniref:amino acid adenylation domain-containing protein n=1 Tax=Micromonospora sp. NPDC005413 TaxID=3154563 RepID=UPI0033B43A1D
MRSSPSVGERFVRQVAARPDGIAVVDGTRRLTYAELHARARGVADRLTHGGVQPGHLVGTAFARSADAVVAMVGVILAGAAYVPLRPGDPPARLRQIADMCDLSHVLCDGSQVADLRAALPDGCAVVEAGAVPPATTAPGDGGVAGTPSSLAYVMFTSGTTGTPKGIMVEHRGVLRLVTGTGYLPFGPEQRFLHAAAPEFDAATFEVWGALLNGASLHIVQDGTLLVPSALAETLRTQGVTVAWLTAPLFHQIVDEAPATLSPLRILVTGGDVVSPAHVRRVRAAAPHLTVLNGYGPTENTTFTTVYEVPAEVPEPLPIGRPIAGTTVMVADGSGRPVPDGTEGELYVGGEGLARGYLGDPELTAARFVICDGTRWYRSGDRATRRPDGTILFHGRADDQVKIAGRLVDPREVDATLSRVPGVRSSYTRVTGDSGADRRLVSYVVGTVTPEGVRDSLRAQLPAYLCPQWVVVVPRLPLTATGKVDWRALPDPAEAGADPVGHTRLSPGHRALAELWVEVLGVRPEAVTPESTFVGLGGDSLGFGRLAARISQRAGVDVPLADLMAAADLAAMAELLAGAPPAGEVPVDGPATDQLHPAQRALYSRWLADPGSLAYNVPFRVRLDGAVRPDRLRAALTSVVARHDAFHGRFALTPDGPRWRHAEPAAPPFEYRAEPTGDEEATFVRPFDPALAPLPRALLVRLGPTRHHLYLDVHHVVFDGVSLRVLMEDLLAEYAGRTPPGPAGSLRQAADRYARRLRIDPDGDEEYWVAQFRDPPARLALPYDRPPGPRRDDRGAVVRRSCGAARLSQVRAAARRHGSRTFSVLLAAYVTLLARLTAATEVAVGMPVHGRDGATSDRTVGMFVNTLCLRLPLHREMTLAELVRDVDRRSREAIAHQGYPFDVLVDRLGIRRDPARTPLFDAFFALQNLDFYEFEVGGLHASVDLLPTGYSRFDLNLQVHQRPDELVVDLEYATALFTAATANGLVERYVAVLDEITRPGHDDVPVRPAEAVPVPPELPTFDFERC